MPAPIDPVLTGAQLAAWLDLTPPTEESDPEQLVELADAVDELVRGLPSVTKLYTGALDAETWTNRATRGAKMLAGRLHRRRMSPEGVYALAGDAVAYVNRNDPDVATLLRLNLPMVG